MNVRKGHVNPFGAAVMGFAWVYVVCAISTNRPYIAQSLQQGSLPEASHGWVLGGLAVMLAVSGVLLAWHAVRTVVLRCTTGRGSNALWFGVAAALALYFMPPGVWQTGFGLLDGTSQQALTRAGASLSDVLPGFSLLDLTHAGAKGG